MAARTLTRRRGQMDLLTHLCAKRRQVTASLPTNGTGATIHTRFLALEPDGVLLEWPPGGLGNLPESGATVAVYFEHLGERLGFRVPARGRTTRSCGPRGCVPGWKLALPVRIEPVEQRRRFRVNLAHHARLTAECTSVGDPTHSFAIQVQNLSSSGLCGTAQRCHAADLHVGATLWTRFDLPGEPAPLEFVLRVAHTHENPVNGTLVFGGAFCAGDDPRYFRTQMRQIERFLTQATRPQPSAARPVFGKGI